MTTPSQEATPPLDELMLAMDVVDTLRHRQDIVVRELDSDTREQQMIAKLREIYAQQGIDVPDHILREGVAGLTESRFVYTPPTTSLNTILARLYVSRARWGRWVLGILLALLLLVTGYNFVYLPFKSGQEQAARVELEQTLPARMDAIYHAIYEETKVQIAVIQADSLIKRGKIAANEDDREGAEQAITGLESLRDQLRQDYTVRVVNREDVQSGFWTFPEVNDEATNYYVVVEAIDSNGDALTLPILNEENDQTEMVDIYGLRVPETVYRTVEADKRDDGIIQRNILGRKEFGYLDPTFNVPVLGGTVTRW